MTIFLWRDKHKDCYIAEYLIMDTGKGYVPDPETVALFGTHILPTAYRSAMASEYVLTEIQKANPQHNVIFNGNVRNVY